MATHGAKRLRAMNENLAHIIAIECLAACQGIDFHQPLLTSAALKPFHDLIREQVPHYDQDRPFTADIEAVRGLIADGRFLGAGACSKLLNVQP